MGRFGERIGAYEALAASVVFSAFLATVLLLVLRQSLAGFGDALHSPWWYWVGGGGMGVVVVFAITVVTPQIWQDARVLGAAHAFWSATPQVQERWPDRSRLAAAASEQTSPADAVASTQT